MIEGESRRLASDLSKVLGGAPVAVHFGKGLLGISARSDPWPPSLKPPTATFHGALTGRRFSVFPETWPMAAIFRRIGDRERKREGTRLWLWKSRERTPEF